MGTGNIVYKTTHILFDADMSCVTEAIQCGKICSVQSIADTDSGTDKDHVS